MSLKFLRLHHRIRSPGNFVTTMFLPKATFPKHVVQSDFRIKASEILRKEIGLTPEKAGVWGSQDGIYLRISETDANSSDKSDVVSVVLRTDRFPFFLFVLLSWNPPQFNCYFVSSQTPDQLDALLHWCLSYIAITCQLEKQPLDAAPRAEYLYGNGRQVAKEVEVGVINAPEDESKTVGEDEEDVPAQPQIQTVYEEKISLVRVD